MMLCNGIELKVNSEASFSHSRIMEQNVNTDYFHKLSEHFMLLGLFKEASGVNSIMNMNYQVCNGGFDQYISNGYHEAREPYHTGDCKHLDIEGQIDFLAHTLIPFTRVVLCDEQVLDMQNIKKLLEEAQKENDRDGTCGECDGTGSKEEECYECHGKGIITTYNHENDCDDEETCTECGGDGVIVEDCEWCECGKEIKIYDQLDNEYYKIYVTLETVAELYAQYVIKECLPAFKAMLKDCS